MSHVLAICIASVAVWGAGCGSDAPPSDVDARVIADAAAKTSAAGTARVSTTITGTYKGHRLGLGTRTGVVDGKRGRGVIDFDFAFLAPSDPEKAREGLTGTIIYYGGVVFVVTNTLQQRYASGKGWYELTRDKLSRPRGPGGGVSGLGTVDPTKPVDVLRAAHGHARYLGTASLDGAAVKRYATVVDLTLYPETVRGVRPALEEVAETFEQGLGARRFPAEAWIASDGTIRRMRVTLAGHDLRLVLTTDLHEIGKPVSVRQPDPQTVFDLRGR